MVNQLVVSNILLVRVTGDEFLMDREIYDNGCTLLAATSLSSLESRHEPRNAVTKRCVKLLPTTKAQFDIK